MYRRLIHGDCLKKLKNLDDNSVDSMVTDPPAGIDFMSKNWDTDKGGRDCWIEWMKNVMCECLRIMKPGAHGFVWALPRVSHRTAIALEDAGFEIRDVVTHLFGSGFPKSLNISKAIDKAAGVEREIIGKNPHARPSDGKYDAKYSGVKGHDPNITAPATTEAKQWDGWGTALKPANEHWILIRKPLSEKTIAKNVLKWGTGGINIDECKIGDEVIESGRYGRKDLTSKDFWSGLNHSNKEYKQGRFPTNLVLSHHEECVRIGKKKFKRKGGGPHSTKERVGTQGTGAVWKMPGNKLRRNSHQDKNGVELLEDWNCHPNCAVKMLNEQSDGTSRFFYCTKASKSERNIGLDKMEKKVTGSFDGNVDLKNKRKIGAKPDKPNENKQNNHPTVKPLKLMQYFTKMVTPPKGIVLDPFMGSGTTGMACRKEKFSFIGIEKEREYFKIAKARIASV
jgi:site-specific DNA-methyltransferase (adenine-specific)